MIDVAFNQRDINRIDKLLKNVSPKDSQRFYKTAMRKSCGTMLRALKSGMRGRFFNVVTGDLRRSYQSLVYVKGDELIGEIGSGVGAGQPVKYDRHLEEGTKYIKARRHKATTVKEQGRKAVNDFIRAITFRLRKA